MVNGNVLQYLARYPEVNRLELVCLIRLHSSSAFIGLQIIGVTRGLGYLHDNGIVHGDLEGVSGNSKFAILLISNGPSSSKRFSSMRVAILFSMVFNPVRSTPSPGPGQTLLHLGLTVRIVAMPLNMPEVHQRVRKSRMYIPCQCLSSRYARLSIVIHTGPDRFCLQLVTRNVPFPDLDDSIVHHMVFEGRRPQKPQDFDALGISPAVWEVAERCWHQEASQRPEIKAVLQDLEEIANLVGALMGHISIYCGD